MTRPTRVCLGVVVGAKGLRGEVRIKTFTEHPADIGAYGPLSTADGRTFAVEVVGGAEGVVIGRLRGIGDRNAAEALKGVELFVDRAALPDPGEGQFYHADLMGAVVSLATGEELGKVIGLHNFGGGDMMEVGGAGASVLIPLTADVVAALDLAAGRVVVNPLPGLLGSEAGTPKEEGGGG